MVLDELIDARRLNKLIRHLEQHDPQSNQLPTLRTYRKRMYCGRVTVHYHYTSNLEAHSLGRLYAQNGVSLQMMSREVRGYLALPLAFDVDRQFVNAHPKLVLKTAKDHGWPHAALERYVTQRESVLAKLCSVYKVDRDKAKEAVLRLVYMGCFHTWEQENAAAVVDLDNPIRQFLLALQAELTAIGDSLMEWKPELVEVCRKNARSSSIRDIRANTMGIVSSIWVPKQGLPTVNCGAPPRWPAGVRLAAGGAACAPCCPGLAERMTAT